MCGNVIDPMTRLIRLLTLLLTAAVLASCVQPAAQPIPAAGDRLAVVATTTIVGDVVAQIGGNHITLDVLIPPDTDPHSFDPTPRDLARISEARLLFANGAGLEEFLSRMIASANESLPVVEVSRQVKLLPFEEEDHPAEGAAATEEADHDHAAGDPHTWTDPNNVLLWVDEIENALVEADPSHAAAYRENAAAYRAQLSDLDAWIRTQVEDIPPANRKILTDHRLFTYFAARYGFEQVGTVIPSYSTLSAPSAQELATLESDVKRVGVKVIFVSSNVNPMLSERVAQDTGIRLVTIYSGSLSAPDGPAGSYLAYMRYNVQVIGGALK